MCSTTAEVSGEPAMRSALVKARRRIASCAHCGTGCSHAPRPGRVLAASTITAYSPFPVDTATTRSSSTANSRLRQPTHVRTGPPVRRCAEAEVGRWITEQSTVRAVGSAHPGGTGQSPGDDAGRFAAGGGAGPLVKPPDDAGRVAAGGGGTSRAIGYRPCASPWLAPWSGWLAGRSGESPRMSIRHPVSRAASRAF